MYITKLMPLFMTGDDKDDKEGLENDKYLSTRYRLCCSHLFQLWFIISASCQ